MGNTPTSGRGTNPTNDENEDEPSIDRPGLDDFQDPPEKGEEEDDDEDRTIGGGGGSGSTVRAGSGSVVTRDEEPEDDAETEDPDEGEELETDTELPGDEEGAEQEDDEDTDPDLVTILQIVDPLSYSSWDMQPVMQRVAEQYRGQIDLRFVPAPVREFDDEIPSPRNGMPLDESLYSDPPATTELVNRAWIAAMRQGRGNDYLRRLWIGTFARGQNLDDESRLVDMANDMGLDTDEFEEDMANADLSGGTTSELPITKIVRVYPEDATAGTA